MGFQGYPISKFMDGFRGQIFHTGINVHKHSYSEALPDAMTQP